MNFIRELIKELDDPMPLPHWLRWSGRPILQAFALSLMLHFVAIIGWECAYQAGIIGSRPSMVLKRMLTPEEAQLNDQLNSQQTEVPLMFIEVNPQEEVEAPEDAKYYSNASTLAGNPEPVLVTKEEAKVKGIEQEQMRTIDQPKPEPQEMNPVQQQPTPVEEIHQESKPEENKKPLFAAKPADLGVAPAEEKPRPRTLREVRQTTPLIGNATKQDGGVRRHSLEVQLDVRGTPFGNYDAAFIAAVQKRWYDLIESSGMVTGAGKVVVVFKLHENGLISDTQIISSTVGDLQSLLCQRAILDPAPYTPWPSELRRAVEGNVRDVKFSFYYR